VKTQTLNSSYQLTAILSQGVELTHSFTLGPNELFRFMPDDFFVPVSLWAGTTRVSPVRSADLDLLNVDWISAIGAPADTPIYYFIHGSLTNSPTLWFYPRPLVSTRFRMTYAAMPGKMVQDNDIPRLPAEHHYTIVLLAYAWELLKERGFVFAGKALRTFNDFVRELNLLQQTVYKRTPDRDWLMMAWDAEAVRRKLFAFEQPIAAAQGTEASDLK